MEEWIHFDLLSSVCKRIKTQRRSCNAMITNIVKHHVEWLDECVLGVNRLCFLRELNGKLSVPNPEMNKKNTRHKPSWLRLKSAENIR